MTTAPPTTWLSPLPLSGGSILPSRIVPGAMEGLSTGHFVKAMSQARLVDCWITPFIRISNAVPRRSRLHDRLQVYLKSGLPVVVQLMGTHTDLIAEAAAICVEIGATAVDLNCGCPSKSVVSSRSGGALLRNPQWIHDTLKAIRRACPGAGLGVKLRSGFADFMEMHDILPAVVAAGPDFGILHFRTVAEMYDPVDGRSERLACARELTPGLTLLASGDIFTIEDAIKVWRDSGLDGVAVARGLLRNPWLIRDISTVCRGQQAPRRGHCDVLGFIAELAERAACDGAVKTGWILEIARNAFGPGKIFNELAHQPTPVQLAACARRLQS